MAWNQIGTPNNDWVHHGKTKFAVFIKKPKQEVEDTQLKKGKELVKPRVGKDNYINTTPGAFT